MSPKRHELPKGVRHRRLSGPYLATGRKEFFWDRPLAAMPRFVRRAATVRVDKLRLETKRRSLPKFFVS
jgi:hypothetical protein